MKPFFIHNGITIYCGDSLAVLKELPSESVHTCITSPPYWGLRDYGTASWEGGDAECDHSGIARRCDKPGRNDKQSTQKGSSSDRVSLNCLSCGATRIDSQLGLERTPEEYVSKMVVVFREVWRVLRSDGTLWLNMGDSYATGTTSDRLPTQTGKHGYWQNPAINKRIDGREIGLKPKDLCGIPWMLAFALRADGWYLRSDIIWAKPNPMPESVTDRPTKSHEYIFLLSKNERYYYDAEAIREESAQEEIRNGRILGRGKQAYNLQMMGSPSRDNSGGYGNVDGARNKRSVWTVATQPFPEAHFATFPEELIKPCILAGCPPGGIVLDPFFGSGTTGLVARAQGCKCIGIELNSEYIKIAEKRLGQNVFDFNQQPAVPTDGRAGPQEDLIRSDKA